MEASSDVPPSLQHVEHALRSGKQAELRREIVSASTSAACQLLRGFSLCASTINAEAHTDLVNTILQLPWRQDVQLASAVCEFVQDLVTASAGFLRPVVDALVESFLLPEGAPAKADADTEGEGSASTTQTQVSQIVHAALQGILRACPLALSHLHEAIKEHFPHSRRDVQCHHFFLQGVLKLLSYAPMLRPRTVHLVVERLVDLDVQISLLQRNLEEAVEEEDNAIFEVELGDASADEVAKMRKSAEKLDEMMVMMFELINLTCSGEARNAPASPSAGADGGTAGEALFEALVSSFRLSVMQTYKCRSTQFLLFFCCSYDASFARAFLRLLIQQVEAELVHSEERAACAAYAASFLARATYLPFGEVLETVRHLLAWAQLYQAQAIARLEGAAASLDVAAHGVFYAVVQGVLYVLCYKHELLLSDECAAARQELGELLHPVLHSELNPLKFCLDNVVVEFERLGLCECAEVIAANERMAIGSRSASGAANRLEDFFPFDPIQLKRCAKLVAPFYQTWVPPAGHERDSAGLSYDESSCSSPDAMSDSLARSLQAMSVTPLSDPDASLELQMRRRLAENTSMFRSNIATLTSVN